MLPTLPPRDANDNVTPHDHQDIFKNDVLIRGVTEHHLVPSATPGVKQVSSMLFSASTGANEGVSCELERLLNTDGINAADRINSNPNYLGGISLSVEEVRKEPLLIGYDPIVTPKPNPYHCQIWSTNPFPERHKRTLLKIMTWVTKPANVA